MPCDYKDYPSDWRQIRARILARAGNRCEKCRAAQYAVGHRDKQTGRFVPTRGNQNHDAAGNSKLPYTEAREARFEHGEKP